MRIRLPGVERVSAPSNMQRAIMHDGDEMGDII